MREFLRPSSGLADIRIALVASFLAVYSGVGLFVSSPRPPDAAVLFVILYAPLSFLVGSANYLVARFLHRCGEERKWAIMSGAWVLFVLVVLLFDTVALVAPYLVLRAWPDGDVVFVLMFSALGSAMLCAGIWADCTSVGYRFADLPNRIIISTFRRKLYQIQATSLEQNPIKHDIDWLKMLIQQSFWMEGLSIVGVVFGLDKLDLIFGQQPNSGELIWFLGGAGVVLLVFHSLVFIPLNKFHQALVDELREPAQPTKPTSPLSEVPSSEIANVGKRS